ncbi:hypothetical Protein YC6258_02756 [Gynuella sunshinyii YC6258]|uniref:Uncharacterized protein n=1 Tax=Gynuella sunshinyii YC6258 TaxID=1445510 RepID=A0A0C5VWK1_9GAMM|nr:hypothetical Protein YC6258_02756 [Gynuella sunshinyii YC6258]
MGWLLDFKELLIAGHGDSLPEVLFYKKILSIFCSSEVRFLVMKQLCFSH